MDIKNTENLYFIGGIVRDELLGKGSLDIDLTYVGDAIEFAKNLDNAEIIQINPPFGTVKIKLYGKEIDIASTRAEIYEKDGHLPTVTKIGCSLKEDVLRRDFTINAIAKNFKTHEIIDYTGGVDDIKKGIIKVLHNRSFIEDPSRILRALKFSIRFNFELDTNTKKLQDDYLQNINYDMSYKRIKKELIETFNLNSQKAYDNFVDFNIYKLITKNTMIKPQVNIETLINKYKNIINSSNIWLIYVGTIRDIEFLKPTLTKDEMNIIKDFEQAECQQINSDFDIYKTFEHCRPESILLYAILKNKNIAEKYLDILMHIKIKLSGQDIANLNIPPSKEYQDCFDFILKKKIQKNNLTYEQELELAKEFFKL